MGTMTLPGIGPVDDKWVYAGGAVVVGIVGYSYFKKSGSGGGTVDETVPDGMAGDPGDGWGNTPGQSGNSGGSYNNADPDVIDTNAEWTQDAISKMADLDYNPQVVAEAIGKYLSRQALSDVEMRIIRTILGLVGMPPIGGPFPLIPALPPTTTPPGNPPPVIKPPAPKPPAPKPPAPKPPAVVWTAVPVVKFGNPAAWNSNLWGIARYFGWGSSRTNYYTIWNDSRNAALRKKRGSPTNIQPNDIVYARRK